jgi:hypothetical protein
MEILARGGDHLVCNCQARQEREINIHKFVEGALRKLLERYSYPWSRGKRMLFVSEKG